jgi:electron transfer flavoprotein beta subunit
MPEFHIVVCVKIVPKPEEVRVDPETWRLDRSDARSEINPPDMNAMEGALRLKDRHDARVSLLSMGPPFFVPLLRVALAMGADHIHLLSDRAFAGADTLATTYTLAQAIEKLGDVDLVICGEESSDGATGQVPAGLAAWLDWPQITMVNEVTLALNQASATVQGCRELEGGHEVLAAPLPAVLSVQTAANEPRFMDFELKPWAFAEGRTTVWDQAALAADTAYLGIDGSPTQVSGLTEAPTRERKREMLEGTADEVTTQLSALLARWEL